jgi:hypothetical protein
MHDIFCTGPVAQLTVAAAMHVGLPDFNTGAQTPKRLSKLELLSTLCWQLICGVFDTVACQPRFPVSTTNKHSVTDILTGGNASRQPTASGLTTN